MIGSWDLNQYTGDGGEQKIITVSFILLIRLLTAIQNFTANKENIT
jgi:hypothetical protein